MVTPLHQSLFATLAYFDQHHYPLTVQEIQQWMIQREQIDLPKEPPTLSELEEMLRQLPQVSHWRGFYFLHTSESVQARAEELVTERVKRYDIAERKWQILMPKVKTISTLPYVRALFVVNTLSWSHARADSDVDLCVVTQPGHIWTARQWVTGWAALKRDRPTATKEANTLCLSLYLTSDHLNFQSVMVNAEDIHLALWLAQFHPVYDPENLQAKLWQANGWMQQLLPYAQPMVPEHRRKTDASGGQKLIQTSLEVAQPAAADRAYKQWQMRIMPEQLKRLANTPGVVISDSMLKFHDKDPRTQLHLEWTKLLNELLSSSR